jgi:hypothetical protein
MKFLFHFLEYVLHNNEGLYALRIDTITIEGTILQTQEKEDFLP